MRALELGLKPPSKDVTNDLNISTKIVSCTFFCVELRAFYRRCSDFTGFLRLDNTKQVSVVTAHTRLHKRRTRGALAVFGW